MTEELSKKRVLIWTSLAVFSVLALVAGWIYLSFALAFSVIPVPVIVNDTDSNVEFSVRYQRWTELGETDAVSIAPGEEYNPDVRSPYCYFMSKDGQGKALNVREPWIGKKIAHVFISIQGKVNFSKLWDKAGDDEYCQM